MTAARALSAQTRRTPRNRVPRRRRRKLPVASVLRTGVQVPTTKPTLPRTEFRGYADERLPVASVLRTGVQCPRPNQRTPEQSSEATQMQAPRGLGSQNRGSSAHDQTNAPRNRVPRRRRCKAPVASVLRTGDRALTANRRPPEQSSEATQTQAPSGLGSRNRGSNVHD
jgi:hypothetical protein